VLEVEGVVTDVGPHFALIRFDHPASPNFAELGRQAPADARPGEVLVGRYLAGPCVGEWRWTRPA